MVKNPQMVDAFEKESLRSENLTLDQKYHILDSMYTHAKEMGAIEKSATLEDIDGDIELARILHLDVQKTPH